MYYIKAFLSQKHVFKTSTAANQLILFRFCFIIQSKAKIRLYFINPNPPDPLPLLLPADLYAIPFSTVCVSYLDQVSW